MKIFHDDVWNITRNRYAESLDIFWPLAQHFDGCRNIAWKIQRNLPIKNISLDI